MRIFLLFFTLCMFCGCSTEATPPPLIQVSMAQIDPEAATIIESMQAQVSSSEDWQKLGMYYQAHGLDDAAIQAYEYAIVLGANPKAKYLLGIAYANLGFYESAITSLSSLPDYIPALWHQGMWQLDLGNLNAAEKLFNSALASEPSTVAAIVGLARTKLSQGDPTEAISILDDLIKRGGSHPYVFYLLGTAHQKAGNIDQAKQLLLQPVSGQPTWEDPWIEEMRSHQRGFAAELGRAVRKIDSGDLQGALTDLKKIETAYPYTPDVQTNLATTQLQLGKLKDAVNTLGAAIRKSPDYAPLHLTMAFAMSQAGEPEKAIEFATTALLLQPSMVMAPSFIGKMAMQQRDYPLALQSFTHALELGDTDLRTRELLAELHLRFGRWADAIEQYNIVLELSPQRTSSVGGFAVALTSIGQKEKALSLLTVALKQFPNDQNLLRARDSIRRAGSVE
jgi:tetratricopeptide (TPR) repeat protein